jgi:predicted regulator of Ras-like GTPase activity (Roadblock/LC7/MglB family)
MRTPAQADLQRWSDEVARDPRSLAFLPLARAYRRQGLHETALQLCLRGLEAYPSHIEAHGLLAALYVEKGEHEKAADEWSIVLRIDPDNFDALRGLGFCFLQQDRVSRARQMLERAALLRPADPAVDEALRLLGARTDPAADSADADGVRGNGTVEEASSPRQRWRDDLPFMLVEDEEAEAAAEAPPAAAHGASQEAPGTVADDVGIAGRIRGTETVQALGSPGAAPARAASHAASGRRPEEEPEARPRSHGDAGFGYSPMADPASLFEDLVGSGPVLGAIVVDAHGLVLAGRMTEPERDAAVLGAVLGGAAFEAARTAAHLSLGEWRGITMEADDALLHIVPAGSSAMVVLAARRGTPAGWMRRAAAQAADRAAVYMEAYG